MAYGEGEPSGSRRQGGTRVWSHVSSAEWSRSNKGGFYDWNKESLRYDICSKQRQYKAGCRDVGREIDRAAGLAGSGWESGILQWVWIVCVTGLSVVPVLPCPSPALLCVPGPTRSDFLNHWLLVRLGQWEEVEGGGREKAIGFVSFVVPGTAGVPHCRSSSHPQVQALGL